MSRLVPGYQDRYLREVWAWNFDAEFAELRATAERGGGVVVACDTEFPGILQEAPYASSSQEHYQALRNSVDHLTPIQVGLAVAGSDGDLRGVWAFNLWFDERHDAHTKQALQFLRNAGLDFPRHATEGIDPKLFGARLAASRLVRFSQEPVLWLTFSGTYDWAFLLKLLLGVPLPATEEAFEAALRAYIPRRHELREQLRHGSLERLSWEHGLQRVGPAHNAGSDALAALELYQRVVPAGVKQNKLLPRQPRSFLGA